MSTVAVFELVDFQGYSNKYKTTVKAHTVIVVGETLLIPSTKTVSFPLLIFQAVPLFIHM